MCELKYDKKFDPKAADWKKLRVKELRKICDDEGIDARRQRAANAGAIEAAVSAMRAHTQVAAVQAAGCLALLTVADGHGAAATGRQQLVADAGAFEAAVAVLRAHPRAVNVQWEGCAMLANVCVGTSAAGRAIAQRAAEALRHQYPGRSTRWRLRLLSGLAHDVEKVTSADEKPRLLEEALGELMSLGRARRLYMGEFYSAFSRLGYLLTGGDIPYMAIDDLAFCCAAACLKRADPAHSFSEWLRRARSSA